MKWKWKIWLWKVNQWRFIYKEPWKLEQSSIEKKISKILIWKIEWSSSSVVSHPLRFIVISIHFIFPSKVSTSFHRQKYDWKFILFLNSVCVFFPPLRTNRFHPKNFHSLIKSYFFTIINLSGKIVPRTVGHNVHSKTFFVFASEDSTETHFDNSHGISLIVRTKA